MALTKVKLISNGVITVDNLNENHGITTTHIGEGDKLFYTDARVGSYLSANNYATTAGGYFSNATLSANILTFDKSDGTTDSVDLSLYLDDTNLARLVSGTLDALTGVATFTRDDSSTFTIDFSAFLSDANDYVSSGSFSTSTGVLTLTRLGGATVTVDLDGKYAESVHTHVWTDITDRPTALSSFTNDSGYLTSFTETDPIYTASSWYTTTNNSADWDAAYGWGDHASAGYLTSVTNVSGYSNQLYSNDLRTISPSSHGAYRATFGFTSWANNNGAPYADYIHLRSYSDASGGSDNLITFLKSGIGMRIWQQSWGSSSAYSSYVDVITSGNIGSQSVNTSSTTTHYSGRTDSAWYNAVWAAGNPSHLYSSDAVQIQSSTGSIRANVFYDNSDTGYYVDPASTSRINTIYFDVLRNPSGNWILGQQGTNYFSFGSSAVADTVDFDVSYITQRSRITLTDDSYYRGSPSYGFRFNNNADTINSLIVDNSGNSIAHSSHRAPIFYDSNDTNYYIDQNSQSRINRLNISEAQQNAVNNAGGRLRITSYTNGESEINGNTHNIMLGPASTRTGTGYYAGIAINGLMNYNGGTGYDVAPHIWFGAQYRDTPGSERSDFVIAIKSGVGVSGTGTDIPQERFRVDYNGIASASGDMRAPIFYDSNNTGYYLDAASTSRINAVQFDNIGVGQAANGSYRIITSGDIYLNANGNGWAEGVWKQRRSGGTWYDVIDSGNVGSYTTLGINTQFLGSGTSNVSFGYSTVIRNENGSGGNTPYAPILHLAASDTMWQIAAGHAGSTSLRWRSGYAGNWSYSGWWDVLHTGLAVMTATGSFRAPIFYDSNDTNYYLDPNSTTRLSRLHINARNDNYYVGSFNEVNALSDWQSLTNTTGQWTVTQYNAIGSYSNSPGEVYTYGAVMSWRTENHSFQLYAAHTGDLAYKTQWNNDNYSGWRTPVVYGHNIGSASGKVIYGSTFYDSDNSGYYLDASSTGDSLRVAGDIVAYYSDERLKNIECNIPEAIEKVKSLNGFYYTANEMAKKLGYKEGRQVGLSAQEVEAIMPEVVKEAAIGKGYKTLDYSKIVPLLVEAIKEQQKQIDELKAIINGTT